MRNINKIVLFALAALSVTACKKKAPPPPSQETCSSEWMSNNLSHFSKEQQDDFKEACEGFNAGETIELAPPETTPDITSETTSETAPNTSAGTTTESTIETPIKTPSVASSGNKEVKPKIRLNIETEATSLNAPHEEKNKESVNIPDSSIAPRVDEKKSNENRIDSTNTPHIDFSKAKNVAPSTEAPNPHNSTDTSAVNVINQGKNNNTTPPATSLTPAIDEKGTLDEKHISINASHTNDNAHENSTRQQR